MTEKEKQIAMPVKKQEGFEIHTEEKKDAPESILEMLRGYIDPEHKNESEATLREIDKTIDSICAYISNNETFKEIREDISFRDNRGLYLLFRKEKIDILSIQNKEKFPVYITGFRGLEQQKELLEELLSLDSKIRNVADRLAAVKKKHPDFGWNLIIESINFTGLSAGSLSDKNPWKDKLKPSTEEEIQEREKAGVKQEQEQENELMAEELEIIKEIYEPDVKEALELIKNFDFQGFSKEDIPQMRKGYINKFFNGLKEKMVKEMEEEGLFSNEERLDLAIKKLRELI